MNIKCCSALDLFKGFDVFLKKCGSSRPESSGPGSTRPGYIGLVLLLPSIFIRGAGMRCVLYIKKCSTKV